MEGTVKVEKYIMADDTRLNYCFVKKEELDNPNKDLKVEWDEIDRNLIDYGVVVEKGEPESEESTGTLDKTIPSSLLSVKNEEDAIGWYQDKHPDLPEGMAEIFAKYHYGDSDDKGKEQRVDKLNKRKKKKKAPNNLEIKRGKFVVKFD
tara:strand:- start:1340 stop:1786 length:447 start_codon:yes stop_codon:yes gene_type:complete